jgi:hypothetical protein
MSVSPATVAIISALLGLFLGGAAAGIGLARALAPDSWVAETVSFFALPVAFATGLQAWYGLALFSLIPRVLRWWLSGSHASPAGVRQTRPVQLPGSFVFLPLSSGAGTVAGLVVGLVSSTYPLWFIVLVYWLVGTLHGLLAWRLARGGVLLPPESI